MRLGFIRQTPTFWKVQTGVRPHWIFGVLLEAMAGLEEDADLPLQPPLLSDQTMHEDTVRNPCRPVDALTDQRQIKREGGDPRRRATAGVQGHVLLAGRQ